MLIDIYLVKDEYSTVSNFRYSQKALDFAATNKDFTVERIEVEVPQYKATIKEVVDVIENSSNLLDKVIDTHILNVYNQTGRNKTKTAKILGITVKTVYNKLDKMEIS